MKIIKPQQLILLRAGVQQGQRSALGISVIAGCYLSRPRQFATEATLWQAWRDAPHIMPVMDNAEPKPFAEYLLAGHVVRDPPVATALARVQVGPLEKRWLIQGDRHTEDSPPQPFSRLALDHPQGWDGGEVGGNPAGKPQPNLSETGVTREDSLAAPSPVPHHFPQRQQYLQQVQEVMNSEAYREQVFPGLPEALDPRYFQLAAAGQWLDASEWPDEVSLTLDGFNNDSQLRCTLPAVRAVALARYRDRPPERVCLQRKTLLLLPDSDLVLIIFTGELPLASMLDEAIDTLMVALDDVHAPRADQHYLAVFDRRTAEKVPPFAFLYDPELMPADSTLEVITCAEQHPDFPGVVPGPQDPQTGSDFYQQIRALTEGYAPPSDGPAVPDSGLACAVTPDAAALIAEQDELSHETFSGLTVTDLTGKTFRHCRFFASSFAAATLDTCLFEHCRFEQTNWQGARLNNVTFEHATLRENDLRSVYWQQVTAHFLTAERCRGSGAVFIGCVWQQCLLAQSELNHSGWTDNQWEGVSLDEMQMQQVKLSHSTLNHCLFNQCEMSQSQLTRVEATATSVLGGDWQHTRFSQCLITSLTVGLAANFTASQFSHCCLRKLGLRDGRLTDMMMECCTVDEGNFDRAVLTGAQVVSSDIAGGRWKDAVLDGSTWRESSLQQGQFYHADLRATRFVQCNLAGAGLAMVRRDPATEFTDSLLIGAIWLPRMPLQALAEKGKRHEP